MDIVVISSDGVWIRPAFAPAFQFSGSAVEFISILIYHTDLDIDSARFLVRESDCGNLQLEA